MEFIPTFGSQHIGTVLNFAVVYKNLLKYTSTKEFVCFVCIRYSVGIGSKYKPQAKFVSLFVKVWHTLLSNLQLGNPQ